MVCLGLAQSPLIVLDCPFGYTTRIVCLIPVLADCCRCADMRPCFQRNRACGREFLQDQIYLVREITKAAVHIIEKHLVSTVLAQQEAVALG